MRARPERARKGQIYQRACLVGKTTTSTGYAARSPAVPNSPIPPLRDGAARSAVAHRLLSGDRQDGALDRVDRVAATALDLEIRGSDGLQRSAEGLRGPPLE